jgi:hypothetical protein
VAAEGGMRFPGRYVFSAYPADWTELKPKKECCAVAVFVCYKA